MRSPHPGPADEPSLSPSRRGLVRTATTAGLATAVPVVLGTDLASATASAGDVGPLHLPQATGRITPLDLRVRS
ncbi:hypothetical protein [Streptomyces sp. B22F1]|uniref:hypothetical protein n=1 Tax=Streptomyces sp. B22F1 TaxID=3153566 RepID=UPI00325E0A70